MATGEVTFDERSRAALARLTENEKQCLRRRLQSQTAKQMALDLGISPHAVEKRLKMARTKLGLSSSLDAARLLAAAEHGYGQPVPQAPDLAGAAAAGQSAAAFPGVRKRPRREALVLGGTMMGMLIAATLAASLWQTTPAPPAAPTPPPATAAVPKPATGDVLLATTAPWKLKRTRPAEMRPTTPEEAREYLAESFAIFDRDHSGYIERGEAPLTGIGPTLRPGEPRPKNFAVTWLRGKAGQAYWIAQVDTNDDGKVSLAEYIAHDLPGTLHSGVPIDWIPPGRHIAPATPAPRRPATAEEARAFLVHSFAKLDRNHSGYIERGEAPRMGIEVIERADAQPRIRLLSPKEGADLWIAKTDSDGDGKVSEAEYIAFGLPGILRNGIPVARTASR